MSVVFSRFCQLGFVFGMLWLSASTNTFAADAVSARKPRPQFLKAGTNISVLGNTRLRHWKAVQCVRFSPDGKTLASASDDWTIKLWDAKTGKLLRTLSGHQDAVLAVAFSPDGDTLVSGSGDRAIKLWDVQTGRVLRTLTGHRGDIFSVAFHPDGKRIASGSGDRTCKVWNFATGKVERTLDCGAAVKSLSFRADGTLLAAGSGGFYRRRGTVRVWKVADGALKYELRGHKNWINSIQFSPDGKTLATASKEVKLWNMATGRASKTLPEAAQGPTRFSPDGKTLATATKDFDIVLWNASSGKQRRLLKGHRSTIHSLSFSADGKRLASSSHDQTIKLWNSSNGKELSNDEKEPLWARCVSVSPDGKTLAVGSGTEHGTKWLRPVRNGTISLWDIQTGKKKRMLAREKSGINCLSFHPDGKTIASASWSGNVMIRDVHRGQTVHAFEGHDRPVMSLHFSPDGKLLATAGMDKIIKVWNLKTGKLATTLAGHDAWVSCVRFSPDGKLIASVTGGINSTLKLWNVQSGREVHSMRVHKRMPVYALAFHPGEKILATSSLDGTIRFWDVRTHKEMRTIRVNDQTTRFDQISDIVFSRDGKTMYSTQLGDVRRWDVATGVEVGRLNFDSPAAWVRDLALSSDGRFLVTANNNGTVYLLRLANRQRRKSNDH